MNALDVRPLSSIGQLPESRPSTPRNISLVSPRASCNAAVNVALFIGKRLTYNLFLPPPSSANPSRHRTECGYVANAGDACCSRLIEILGVIWAWNASGPLSLLLHAVAVAPGPLLAMGLILRLLSNSKMNCQSKAPPMKDLIDCMCTIKEPSSDFCWSW